MIIGDTMKLVHRFVCLLSISAGCFASVITTGSVSSQAGNSPFCSNSNTTGVLIACNSIFQNESAAAEASASALFANASVHSFAGSTAAGTALADSRAQFDELVVIPGSLSGTVIGQYAYSFSLVSDFNLGGGTLLLTINQGNGAASIPGINNSGVAMVTSAFTAGAPFEVTVNITSHSSSIGHESETSNGSVHLLGFVDANGSPVAFTVVPEPSTISFSIAGLLFASASYVRARRGRM